MNIQLQQTGHRESRYERPNQTWVCGWAADGRPCTLGPDRRGRCPARAEAECAPRRDGDRYHCTRLDAFGGACEPGPLPDGSCCGPEPEHPVCQPRLSIRALRGRLNLAVFIGAIGALLVGIAGPWRLEVVSPGELASVHRAFERPSDAPNDCAVCHVAAEQGPLGWISGAIGDHGSPDDNRACLRCHFADTTARPHAFSVHGLPADVLDAARAPLACATYHREHRGRDHDLAFMDDTRCQVCHKDQFKSFSSGHPEFRTEQRHAQGIAFDHTTHQEHFGKMPFDCLQCHEPDARGRSMVLKPFDVSCVGCHSGGSSDHHGDKITNMGTNLVIQLDTEENLPPFMRLLLAGDDDAVDFLVELEDVDVVDELDDENKNAFATAFKRLVDELLDGDPKPRIARALGVPATSPAVAALADELSSATGSVLAFKERWLPGPDAASIDRDGPMPNETGWYHDPDQVAIGYRVTTHADRFVKAWVDALATPGDARPAIGVDESDGDRQALRESFTEELRDSFATCLRCHEAGRWDPADREVSALGDRRPFEHGTHLRLFGATTESCDACHRLSEPSGKGPGGRSRHGFLEYARSDCATCHRPGRAADSCLTCHRYHVLRP